MFAHLRAIVVFKFNQACFDMIAQYLRNNSAHGLSQYAIVAFCGAVVSTVRGNNVIFSCIQHFKLAFQPFVGC